MSKKKKEDELIPMEYDTELETIQDVSEVLAEDVNSSILDFIANKLADNLEMKINISKNKNTNKLGLSFSVNYDDK